MARGDAVRGRPDVTALSRVLGDGRSWLTRSRMQASLGRWDLTLEAADRGAALLRESFALRDVRETKEILRLKERALTALGRHDETESVRREIFAAPPRDPATSPRNVDLSRHYNSSLYDGRGWLFEEDVNLADLPERFHAWDADLRGIVQLGSAGYDVTGPDLNDLRGTNYPDEVTIDVKQRAGAVLFLHAIAQVTVSPVGQVARFVIHYEDGSESVVPLIFGNSGDVHDWIVGRNEHKDVIWRFNRSDSPSNRRGLFRKRWENPHPDKLISHIDFVSAKLQPAPFLVAITLE